MVVSPRVTEALPGLFKHTLHVFSDLVFYADVELFIKVSETHFCGN